MARAQSFSAAGRRVRLYIAEGVAKNDREIADCGMRKKNPRGEHTAEPVGIPFAQGLTDVNAPFCAAAARRNRPPAGSLCAWKRILWKLATESALLVRVVHRANAHFWPALGPLMVARLSESWN